MFDLCGDRQDGQAGLLVSYLLEVFSCSRIRRLDSNAPNWSPWTFALLCKHCWKGLQYSLVFFLKVLSSEN
jgi:hypothetical protein